jgi:hypothetical protein
VSRNLEHGVGQRVAAVDRVVVTDQARWHVLYPSGADRCATQVEDSAHDRTGGVSDAATSGDVGQTSGGVIGCGGSGSAVVSARNGNVGPVSPVSPDPIEPRNPRRFHGFSEGNVGRPKAEYCTKRLYGRSRT